MKHLNTHALFRQHAYVNGIWVAAESDIAVINPATGEALGSVPNLGREAVRAAIAAADAALPAWRGLLAKECAAILRRWHELMLEHADDLARIITLEQGKPLAEARGEVVYAAGFLEWFGEEAKRVCARWSTISAR